jgi:hypothetical protein
MPPNQPSATNYQPARICQPTNALMKNFAAQ